MNKVPKLPGFAPVFRVVACAAIALAAAPWSLFAQTATTDQSQNKTQTAPAPAAASTDEMDQQVVRMNPFTVTAQTEGYQAVDTLGGARVRVKLSDTPSSISVITKSFLNDTGITDAQQLLLYTADTEIAGMNGNFSGVSSRGIGVSSNAEAGRLLDPFDANRSRGLTPMDLTRNYFTTEIPWDSFNSTRVDISRGPNSFLFGVGSPSGIMNYSTNQAEYKNEGTVEARYGSFGSTRESLDLNRVLIPNELAIRVDLLNDDTQYRQQPAFNHSKRAYAALRYDPKLLETPSSHMTIKINAESGQVQANNPRELPPMDFITGYFTAGMNKAGYDPFVYNTNQQLTGVGSFVGAGSGVPVQPSLNPWVNAQDYHYIWPGPNAAFWYDGKTGAQLQAMTTLNGVVGINGPAQNLAFPQAAALYTTGFQNYAMTENYLNPNIYPGAYAGTVIYNNKSLANPSIFNFYDNLIDGPNKQEWQNWSTFNVTVEETLLNNRIAIQGIIDHQKFDQGQVEMFGYTEPFISVDLNANQIMYPSWSGMAVTNPNEGRAFAASDTGSGANSTSYTHDNYQVTLNGDLRSQDFLPAGLATKILGHHTITALFGEYRTTIDSRNWDTYATDTTFANAMGDPTGSISGFRTISWVEYLGPSMVNKSSPAGLNLSNIANSIAPTSTTILSFNNTWTGAANGVSPSDPWADPSPYAAAATDYQAYNPANYKGWTSMPVNILNWHKNINQLYTAGNKTEQVLKSASFMYQGHFLDDVILPEYSWRRDELTQRSSNAPLDPNTHVASMDYGITGNDVNFATTSRSYGVTLHLPKSLRAKLPLGTDVSLFYFHGHNETPKVRYAFDATQLPNETGKTDDYGIEVTTLHGHATIRLTRFKTLDLNGEVGSGAADPLGNNGYYLYLLPAWGAADAAASGMQLAGMNTNGFAQNSGSIADQTAAVAAWKANFASYFPQSFFDSYGLGVNVAALTSGNWTDVYNNPSAFAANPYPWTIANTGGGRINGSFPIITQNIKSKGYELQVVVRPINNWDLKFNATKVSADQTSLGSQDSAFINKEYQFFTGPAGDLPLWGYWGGAGGGSSTLHSYFVQNIWSAYLLQEAQTGTMQPELPKWQFNAVTNYTFDKGPLKGFNIGGGFRYYSKPILGYGITEVNGQWTMDAHKPLYGPIAEHFDAWIGYQHKLSSKLTWKIQLHVYNVGEQPHLVPVSVEPDGTYAQQRIEVGQTWEVTNTIMF